LIFHAPGATGQADFRHAKQADPARRLLNPLEAILARLQVNGKAFVAAGEQRVGAPVCRGGGVAGGYFRGLGGFAK
jgi:hypothetical protein